MRCQTAFLSALQRCRGSSPICGPNAALDLYSNYKPVNYRNKECGVCLTYTALFYYDASCADSADFIIQCIY